MRVRALKVRWSVLVGLLGLLAAGRAYAQTGACQTDIDCPGSACGGQVCRHSSGLTECVNANTEGASGFSDGWCADMNGAEVNSNCKCASMGATCAGFFCTSTIPASGSGGGGGGPGTGGSSTGGSTGTGGSSTGGSSGTAGTGGGGGGCSVAGALSTGGSLVLALFIAGFMRLRGRRRA